jgi:isochorismate synthase EntC
MNLINKISHSLFFSKDTDHRFAKSLKNVKEADLVVASINQRLFEIDKQLKSNTLKYS